MGHQITGPVDIPEPVDPRVAGRGCWIHGPAALA